MLIMDELLTTKEVADILRRHPYTIKRLIRKGTLTAHMIGGAYRIKRTDLDRYIEAQKIKKQQTED